MKFLIVPRFLRSKIDIFIIILVDHKLLDSIFSYLQFHFKTKKYILNEYSGKTMPFFGIYTYDKHKLVLMDNMLVKYRIFSNIQIKKGRI